MSQSEREERVRRAFRAAGYTPDDHDQPGGRWSRDGSRETHGIIFSTGQSPRHIDRIVWKPIIWRPESPDQYADGLPPAFKPEWKLVPLSDDTVLYVEGQPLAPRMRVCVNWCPGVFGMVRLGDLDPDHEAGEVDEVEVDDWQSPPEEEATPMMELWEALHDCTTMARIEERAEVHQTDRGEDFTVFGPGGEDQVVLDLPADKDSITALVDALLYVQRRTHEHDWEGPDDGLEELEG